MIVPWRTWMGTNRAYPNREPYFSSTCLDLDAFEGKQKNPIRSIPWKQESLPPDQQRYV
jgi:hypothetical protein